MRTTTDLNRNAIPALAALLVLGVAACSHGQLRASREPAQPSGGAGVLSGRHAKQQSRFGKAGGTVCRVIKFEYDDESDDDTVARLVAKPIGKNTKILRLLICESDQPCVRLDDHGFDPYEAEDLLRRGLICSVRWKYAPAEAGKKPTAKQLVALNLEPLEVRGKILRIEEEYVTLRARPTKTGEWPHLPRQGQSSSLSRKSDKPRALKLRLRILDEVTECRDAKNRSLELWDFAEGQEVEAYVVLGRNEGILVALRAMPVEQ